MIVNNSTDVSAEAADSFARRVRADYLRGVIEDLVVLGLGPDRINALVASYAARTMCAHVYPLAVDLDGETPFVCVLGKDHDDPHRDVDAQGATVVWT